MTNVSLPFTNQNQNQNLYECCICCEENIPETQMIFLQNQQLHLSCLIEILKTQRSPKNPFTSQSFSLEEQKEIETVARGICPFFPEKPFRDLVFWVGDQIKTITSLGEALDIPNIVEQTLRFQEDVQNKIYASIGDVPYDGLFRSTIVTVKIFEKIALQYIGDYYYYYGGMS